MDFSQLSIWFYSLGLAQRVKQIDIPDDTGLGLLVRSGNFVCLFIKVVIYFMCVAALLTCSSVYHSRARHPHRPVEGIRSPRAGVTNCCPVGAVNQTPNF